MKTCTGCGESKSLDLFSRKKRANKTGYASKCKDCHNKYYKEYWKNSGAYEKHKARMRSSGPKKRAAKYGLTEAEVTELFESAGHLCRICSGPATCIDHDHKTGAVRGVLCHGCNKGLGFFCDDPKLLLQAVTYLASVSA